MSPAESLQDRTQLGKAGQEGEAKEGDVAAKIFVDVEGSLLIQSSWLVGIVKLKG